MSGARKDVVFQLSPTLSFYDSLTHRNNTTTKDLPPLLTSSYDLGSQATSVVHRHGELFKKVKNSPDRLDKIFEQEQSLRKIACSTNPSNPEPVFTNYKVGASHGLSTFYQQKQLGMMSADLET